MVSHLVGASYFRRVHAHPRAPLTARLNPTVSEISGPHTCGCRKAPTPMPSLLQDIAACATPCPHDATPRYPTGASRPMRCSARLPLNSQTSRSTLDQPTALYTLHGQLHLRTGGATKTRTSPERARQAGRGWRGSHSALAEVGRAALQLGAVPRGYFNRVLGLARHHTCLRSCLEQVLGRKRSASECQPDRCDRSVHPNGCWRYM